MAKKSQQLAGVEDLNAITRLTRMKTYGVSKDIPGILTNDVEDFISKLNSDKEKNKSLINSHVTRSKLDAMNRQKNIKSLYDYIDDKDILDAIEGTTGSENVRFSQMLKDYEMVKRCIPQIHKVITSIRNNIISPDSMGTDNVLTIKFPSTTTDVEEEKIRDIIDKYKINQRLQNDIVPEYLIASVKYTTVVPYSIIPEMLFKDPDKPEEMRPITECIQEFEDLVSGNIKTLSEATSEYTLHECSSLLESVALNNEIIPREDIEGLNLVLNEQLNNIEFVDGALAYYKDAIMNEAVNIIGSEDRELKSMKNILKKARDNSSKISNMKELDTAAEGLINAKTYNDIKKKVDFKGAHIEYLPAARTIAFKMRDTVIGYFYVEDKVSKTNNSTTMSIMDKINSSVYIKNKDTDKAKQLEDAIIHRISDKLIKAVDSKFINDNYDDMDIIYEFVRANELHRKSKRVVFFHPDDVCEFRRADGSIMKNAMFFAKLVILMLLSNILTKVMRGSDRQIHYVKTGLTTDIEGAVNDTIRAIKQNQIRYSDIGTINEIFNVVGSNVDVFMPVSIDGEEPIRTETISGQNVDMNDDFINMILRSIIMAFGYPAALVDDYQSVEFAKTVAMQNIDVAKATYDAQLEINPDLTKLVQLLIRYELPDFEGVEDIKVQLNPPSVITYEMNRDRISSVEDVTTALADLVVAPEGETIEGKRRRLFKLEMYKQNMPNLDWASIENIAKKIQVDAKTEEQEDKLSKGDENNEQY